MAAKLRVLCVHGYRQNDQIFREKTGAFRKLAKGIVDFVFVAAPHVVPEPDNLAKDARMQERGWWFSRADQSYNATDTTDICLGYEESLDTLEAYFEREGPFDGMFSFSQGASLVSLLAAGKLKDPFSKVKFRFAILVSGFRSALTAHQNAYTTTIACPSLHIFGDSDSVIPVRLSVELAEAFENAQTFRHSGGHYVLASAELKATLVDFLKPFVSM